MMIKKTIFNKTQTERIFLIFSFIILMIATVLSFILPAETRSVIPYPKIIIPFINTICTILCFLTIFKMNWYMLQYAILFIESICTILTGYELLGIFLYSAFLIKLFVNGFFVKKLFPKIFILILIWLITILGLIPFGFERVILSYASLCFFCTFYLHIYKKMENDLIRYMPPVPVKSEIKLPPYGEKLYLSDYNLSDRQNKFLMEYLKNGKSYKSMAEIFIVSESIIKTEMSRIQRKFGVKNREDLRVLLLQYEVVETR